MMILAVVPALSLLARSEVKAAQIDAIFSSLKSENAPGAAVLVIKSGNVAFKRGYGVSDLRSRTRINQRTNFRLASLSKQFTAMAIMLLVHDGKLHYEDKLTDVFPDFPDCGRAITIRHLLNHTSGLLDYEDLMGPQNNVAEDKLRQIKDAEVLELLKKQRSTKFTPGTKWEYSNSGYVVLAMVVEKVSGQPYGQFLHDRIFAPLRMKTTLAYERGRNEVPHRAFGHTNTGQGWVQTDQSPTSATLGDGGIYSSLDDLAKWDAALQRHTLLNAAEMQAALTPVRPPGYSVQGPHGEPAEYGFGWFVDPYHGQRRMWHYGETIGFRSNIQRLPDNGLTIIVLCNRADLDPEVLALKVADLYLGK